MWNGLGSRILALIGLALGASAAAQDLRACGGMPQAPSWVRAGVYTGTLGTSAIMLGLDPQEPDVNRYFYAGRSSDVFLTAFHSGEALILQEEVRKSLAAAPVVTGCFTLSRAGGLLRGSWKVPGRARTLKVSLEPLNVAGLPLKLPASPGLLALRKTDPLAFVKLNHAWKVSADGQQVREPLSGLDYPRLPNASAALQAALQDRQLFHAVNALDCVSRLPEDSRDEAYELRASVTLLSTRLISLREDASFFCGGAHPDHFTVGLILDRLRGRPVSLVKLWPSLTPARLKTLYLAARPGEPESECAELLREMTPSFAAHLGPAGLSLTPDTFPHVAAACAESVMVPYGQLRRGANPASPYFPDLYQR